MPSGKLYVVATPIGNMKDITLRAIETLKNVSYILSEDTRETAKILKEYSIQTQQISYRDQNHNKVLPQVLLLLEAGNDLALVSDSGTPLISDPGFKLVREVRERGFDVRPVPGANAAIAALSVSGIPTDKFVFLGFLPKAGGHRKQILKNYSELDATLVIYESPFRIKKLLSEVYEVMGDRKVAMARELTKLHEEVNNIELQTMINDVSLLENIKEKGEYVVLVSKKENKNEQ